MGGMFLDVAVGSSEQATGLAAGRECGAQVMASLGGAPGLVIAFCGGRQNPEDFLSGLRERIGATPVVGGSALGGMTPDVIGATGFECVAAAFPARMAPLDIRAVDNAVGDERATGEQLAESLLPAWSEGGSLLLLYDSIASAAPPLLHVGSRLVEGIQNVLDRDTGGTTGLLLGAGTLADLGMNDSWIFDGEDVRRHAAVGLVMPATLAVDTTIAHGCVPASGFHEITRIHGAEVYELDGRPACEVIADALSISPRELPDQRLSLALTLGEKHGDPYAPFEESQYVNRLVMNADPERGTVTLFEADYRVGTWVQLMVTDADRMCASVDERVTELLAEQNPDPDFALYIDCAGRCSHFNGTDADEAAIVRERLAARDIPWLGFYSGVEIAPYLGRSRPLDWTGVLATFSEVDPADGR